MNLRPLIAGVLGAAVTGSVSPAIGAGPLVPPSGPIDATMKPLDEVEPRTAIHQADIPLDITAPGSYYLAENITFPAATSGLAIRISSVNVTLDLNGFTIDCQDVSGDAFSAIGVIVSQNDCLVRNGSIVNAGIGVAAQSTRRVFIEGVRVLPTDDGTGIQASNDASVVACEVDGGTICFDTTVASNFLLRDCVARGAQDACYEFRFNNNGHVENCVALGGVYGFRLGDSADDLVFLDCTANSSSIGFADLSAQSNFFYRNIAVRNNVAYQFIANVSATPATAGPWDNISQ